MGRFVELNNRENQKKEKAPASGGGRFVQIGDTSKIGAYTGTKFGQVEKKSAPTTGASPQKKPASVAAPAKKQISTQTPWQSQISLNAQTSAGFQRDIDDLNAKTLAISREKDKLSSLKDFAKNSKKIADLSKQSFELSKQIADLEKKRDAKKAEEDQALIDSGEYRKANLKDILVNSAKQGYYNSLYGEESYKSMSGRKNDKEKYANILDSDDYKFVPQGKIASAVSGAAGLLGQQVYQTTNPTALAMGATAAAGAAIAGQAGPQALVPEEVLTVPSALVTGLKIASAEKNYEIEAGLAYNEMLENGVSEKTARNVAAIVGGVNAGLEALQLDELAKSVRILKNNPLTGEASKRLSQYLIEKGLSLGNETLQEVLQEGSTIAGAQIANKIDKGEWAYSGGEVADRLKDTAVSSALSFGVAGLPSTVIDSTNIYRAGKRSQQLAQQGVQERADVQEGTPTAPAQMSVQTAQAANPSAVDQTFRTNPVSMEEQVLRQREAAVQKTFTGIADKLGDSGRKAFQAAYQGTDRGAYTGEFLRAYHAGMTNQENPNSTSAVSFAAYTAGQNDAAASLAREKRAAQFAKTAGTDSGLVFDDYVSREMNSAVADEVNTVSKALGVRTRMVDQVLGGQANGQINGSDILIAKDAADPALQVVGHEWTHRVQELAPEQYRAFRDAVTSMPDVQEAANILLDQYNRAGVETSYEQALDEATANYAGEMIANSDVLDDFIQKHNGNRTLLQKLRDAIHEIVGKLTGRAKRQAQTVEGKLQAAFEAASKQAESLQNRQTDGRMQETRYAVKEGMDDGRENEIGGRTDTGNRKEYGQSLDREGKGQTGRVRGEFSASAGRYGGVNPSFGAKPVRTWAEGNTVKPDKGSVAYEEQQAAVNYGVPSFVVADAAWAKNKGNTPAFSTGGQIFFRETLPEQNRGMITPHEVTHVMKQVGYKPYLDFVERTPEMLNMSDPVTRILLDHVAKHQRTTMENADPLRLYDEFNATIYGHIATGQTEMFTDGIGIHVFHDFAAYAKELNELHERFKADNQKNGKEKNRYSLKTDSQGRELTEAQREYFKDSKVVDSDGQLKVMYRGGTGDFTVFDRKKSSYSNLYGRGFYFTDSEAHAKQYGNARAFYLNITTPVSTTETTITRDQMRKFLKAVAANEDDFSFENYGYDATVSSVLKSVYGKSDFAMLYDVNQTAIGDMVAAVELFNEVNGTNYDGLILDTETVAFQSNQIKNVDNKAPTSNPDIRYSLKTYSDVEQRDHRKKAIAFFGKTYNWNETGYLTPAGTKLDFSGKHEGGPGGYRTVDHRDIRDAIGEDYGGDDYSGSMVQFMSEGNIRISPESGGINLSVEPTKSQLDALSDFIGKNRGEVILDLDTPDGQTVSSTEYPRGTHSSKVLNDIKAYFKDGTKPHVSELAQFLSLKGTENAQELAALKRENETLKERVEYWKGQTRRSQGVTTDRKAVQKAADALVKDYGAEISGSDIAGDLQSLYDYIASGKDGRDELTYTEARRRSDAIAERIAESAVEVDDRAYREYADLRKYLKDTKLTLTEADAAEITDFTEFRKGLFGKLKIGKGEHTNVDQIYSELSNQYPEFFNEERETNISDQVQRIADVANQLYSVTEYNPFEGYMGQAVASISNDIMDRFFDLPQTKKTFADRAAEQVQEAKFQGKQAANDAFLAGQMSQGRQDAKRLRSTAQALAKERTRRAEQVQALKERYREKDVTRRDNQKRRELRAKIVRHASALSQKLLRPTDNQHIPEEMRSAVAKVLESINQESGPNARSFTLDPVTKERIYKDPGTPTNRTVAFQNLKEQYQKIAQDGDMVVDPSLLGGDDVAGGFSEVIKMGDTRLADLTTEQLKTMWNVLKSVEHSVTTAGKTLASEKFATTKQFADALRMDGMTRRRKLGNNVAISLETPYTFFAHFGQTGKDIYRMLRNAQDRQEIMARDVAEKVHQILGDAKTGIRENAVTAMNEEVHHFTTTEGRELDLTTAQAMELYLLSERKQAEDHLLKGGIVQPEIKIPGKTKIPRGTDVIHLSAEDIQSIVKTLTPEQIRIADGLQKLTTGVLANYGNEASMKAYGYKKFTEQDYWPIKSAKEALHSSQEKDSGNVRSIKNIGMAQAVKPKASNALEVRSVFSTFADHASDMIDYAAWLCPMEDANRLYNFQFRDSEGNLVQTVKGFLEEKGGQGSQQYWQKLMGDIQNGIKTKDFEPLTDKFAKGIGSFKGAAVGANVRVVIQQPTAFFRASAVLDPADMARGLTGGVTKGNGWEKALTHSPIAMRKDVGSFDISSPYTLNDRFYGKEGISNKINDKAGAPAGKADAVTWGALWNACEWQVKRERPNLRAGSSEFYSAVNEVFTSMIDQTQVVDGILQRSNIMRGKSDLAKQATSFMGEPIMSLNVFMRAWDNMRYEENPAKRSKAIKTVGRAAAALLVTDVVNALAQSIADAGRDDDPDKDYWEKFLTALTGITGDEKTTKELLQHIVLEGNLGSNINKLGSIPFVKDILSLTQGYSVSRTDMQVFSDIVSASKDFTASMGGSGKKTREEALANMFAACSKLFGLPVANIKRDAMAAVRTAVQATGSVALEYEFEKFTYNIYSTANKSRYLNLAFKALEQGDLTTYEHIRKELKDFMALDNSSVDSSMRSKLDKEREDDENFSLPDAAASLIGAKNRYGTGEGEDRFTENDLSSDDYIVYSRRKSELYSSMESGLENSQVFRAFTDEQKDKALSSAETYAKKTALHETDKTYEITDKWVLNAQEAQKKYGIKPEIYVALKTQVSDLESVKDRNGETIPNSKGLLIMQAVYNMPGLSEKQRNALFEYLGVGKSIRHYNKALVNEKVRKNARLAGK
nr:MAG TPA: chromosome segregation protein [Caudoviricetes sp.]